MQSLNNTCLHFHGASNQEGWEVWPQVSTVKQPAIKMYGWGLQILATNMQNFPNSLEKVIKTTKDASQISTCAGQDLLGNLFKTTKLCKINDELIYQCDGTSTLIDRLIVLGRAIDTWLIKSGFFHSQAVEGWPVEQGCLELSYINLGFKVLPLPHSEPSNKQEVCQKCKVLREPGQQTWHLRVEGETIGKATYHFEDLKSVVDAVQALSAIKVADPDSKKYWMRATGKVKPTISDWASKEDPTYVALKKRLLKSTKVSYNRSVVYTCTQGKDLTSPIESTKAFTALLNALTGADRLQTIRN